MALEVESFTVGPVAENAHLLRLAGSDSAVIVDPGDESERLLAAIAAAGVELEAILLTHTHFDHIGAVADIAEATGAPVYCPAAEAGILADPSIYAAIPGIPPIRPWQADHTLDGGERLELAGLEIDVLPTPGHSIGHVTYAVPSEEAIFSGDVLFKGSIGRTDLPGGDAPTLLRSIDDLLDRYPDAAVVYPGHMENTTLGAERATNPFLSAARG